MLGTPVSPFAAMPSAPAPVPSAFIHAEPAPVTQPRPIAPPVVRPSLFGGGTSAPKVQAPAGPPPEIYELIAKLQRGLSDQERERAAEALTASTWATHPDVLGALTAAGRNDPFPAVRATCLRCVARINFNQMPQ
jgi:hypothetical protein